MKHFFFLFALTALFFTACTSSDDNENGGIPAVADPKSVEGFPGSYQSVARTKTYEVADQDALDAYKAAWEGMGDGTDWTCVNNSCTAVRDSYNVKADLVNQSGVHYIALSVKTTDSSTTIPSEGIFESSLPPVTGSVSKNGYIFSLAFAEDGAARDSYKTAYIAALIGNGFELQSSGLYLKELNSNTSIDVEVYSFGTAGTAELDIRVQIHNL